MYVPKTARRRTQDPESNKTNQIQRKRKREIEQDTTDSVEILGESQIVLPYKNVGHRICKSNGEANLKCLNSVNIPATRKHCIPLIRPGSGQCREQIRNSNTPLKSNHCQPFPVVPGSNLRESERMLFVQRWINSISPDLPLWVQVAVNKIVPVSNPHCYPTEEVQNVCDDFPSNSDTFAMGTYSTDRFLIRTCNSQQMTNVTTTTTITTNCRYKQNNNSNNNLSSITKTPNSHHFITNQLSCNTTTTTTTTTNLINNNNTIVSTTLGPRFPSTLPSAVVIGRNSLNSISCTTTVHKDLVGPRHACHKTGSEMSNQLSGQPVVQHQNLHHQLKYAGGDSVNRKHKNNLFKMSFNTTINNNNNNNCTNTNEHCIVTEDCNNTIGRLFDDIETQLVVKLFRDHFTKGSCPMLKEIRNRIMSTVLNSRRTANGIRAKIKRLQKSGRWTDYIS